MTLYEKYFDDLIHLFPTINDSFNIPKYKYLKSEYENNISSSHLKKQKIFYNKYLALLNKKKTKNINDKILEYKLKNYLEGLKYNFHLIPLNHQTNSISYFVEMATGDSLYNFENKDDYDSFILKTKNFIIWIDTAIDNMKSGIKKKYVLSKLLCKLLINQLVNIVKNKSYHNKKATKKFNKELDELLTPKILELTIFLKKEYLPYCIQNNSTSALPNGKTIYRYLVKSNISRNDLTIKKIYNIGLSECKRINRLMNKIKIEYGFKGSLKQFNKYIKSIKKYKFKTRKNTLNYYRNLQKKINKTIMKPMFRSKISHDYLIKPVPEYNEKFSSGAYYLWGDLFKKRKGTFYLNLCNYKYSYKYDAEALTLHEGNPGHHYQITYVNDSKLPLFIKLGGFTAYEEGWALYCENLGEYKNRLSYYGKLNMEMLRAVRLVIDTSIHYYNWSEKKCLNFMQKYLFYDNKSMLSEIHRYMAIPAQALSYKIGELTILELKKKFKGSTEDFHQKILENGSLPLELLIENFN